MTGSFYMKGHYLNGAVFNMENISTTATLYMLIIEVRACDEGAVD